jgi:hypothetical protein
MSLRNTIPAVYRYYNIVQVEFSFRNETVMHLPTIKMFFSSGRFFALG